MRGQYCLIAPDVKLGRDVSIHNFVNLYGCEIGDGSRIGSFVEIQKGSRVGRNCKISSHTFICEGVTIEDEVFIGHGNVSFHLGDCFVGDVQSKLLLGFCEPDP